MKIDEIQLMYDYNYWANERMLTTAAQITPEQFTAPTSFSWGSLRNTLVHTMDTEYGWRTVCQHSNITPDLKAEDYPDLASIKTRWQQEERDMRDYLKSLSDADLSGLICYEVDGNKRERVLWHCLFHVVNHGMQHRSECAAMLTDFGKSPGDIDFTVFLSQR